MTTPSTPISPDAAVQQANQAITETYDNQIYTSNAFPFTSPGHLRTAAHLWGLDSVPLETARVLELGCAGGGNLLPFATAYPNAHVVGVDLSSVQIAQGQLTVKALGLSNLHLHAMSLTDISPEFGQFDYIIAHGVFSWVPPEVREAILRILSQNLSPIGMGYVSYNTYPGWKAGDIVRDAMLLHSHSAQSDEDKLASAKTVLNLLSEGISSNNPLAPSLRNAVAQLRNHSDYYIAHEYLEIFNNPCYLLEFINQADQYGLTHVGDSDPYMDMAVSYGQNVQLHHSLVAMGQPRELRHQYLDFAVGRNFRKSLITHKARAEQIPTDPDMSRLADLRWAGHFAESKPEPNGPQDKRAFRNNKNQYLYTNDTNMIAVMGALSAAWPMSLDIVTLAERVKQALQPVHSDAAAAQKTVLDVLQHLFRLNNLRFTLEPSPYDKAMVPTSTAPALIPGFEYIFQQRRNTTFGIGNFNLWHDNINLRLKDAEVFALRHINGNNSRKQLAALLRDALARGTVPDISGKFLKGQRNLDTVADRIIGRLLDLLQRQGLLQ
ncbi:methyltransferase regulatory domain-containing protein [Pollutimonas sp. M17]|uniref:methyltransferase regulatory domain-containing protein n=1 Tax=Pollutimonas sp. M17 TaxID=2962065 RepID=UPI0021F43373|nr:class I SAM-dependent methyltransferase [Pollutimonas sp. M17]UYO94993.1 class I SAM-dependent methyltransferase [Pollutimonas sp. M17]